MTSGKDYSLSGFEGQRKVEAGLASAPWYACPVPRKVIKDLMQRRDGPAIRNPVFRFIYWNINYHLEHHMFLMLPYHALPKLHEAMKADSPPPYPSYWRYGARSCRRSGSRSGSLTTSWSAACRRQPPPCT